MFMAPNLGIDLTAIKTRQGRKRLLCLVLFEEGGKKGRGQHHAARGRKKRGFSALLRVGEAFLPCIFFVTVLSVNRPKLNRTQLRVAIVLPLCVIVAAVTTTTQITNSTSRCIRHNLFVHRFD